MSDAEKKFFAGVQNLFAPGSDRSQAQPPPPDDLSAVADSYHDNFKSELSIKEEPLFDLCSEDDDPPVDPTEVISEFVSFSYLFYLECRVRERMSRPDQLEFLELITKSSSLVDFSDLSPMLTRLVYFTRLADAFSKFKPSTQTSGASLQSELDSHMQSTLYPGLGSYPFHRIKATQLRVHTFLWSYLVSCTTPSLFRFDFTSPQPQKDLFSNTGLLNPTATGILIGLRHASLPDLPKFSCDGVLELFCHSPPLPLGIEPRDWSCT